MPEKVLVYSRFPKSMMVRIGERFELMDAAGKPPREVFTLEQLSGVRAMITAGGTPLGGAMMDKMPKLEAIRNETGEIVDVTISYPCDLAAQMLEYSAAILAQVAEAAGPTRPAWPTRTAAWP